MEELTKLSLTDLRNLTKENAEELFRKLKLDLPKHADLEYIRSNLRLFRLQLAENNTYENQLALQLNNALQNRHSSTNSSIEDDFSETEYEEIDFKPVIAPQQNMAQHEKTPFATPSNFAGNPSESVEMFMNRFEKAATLNNWNDNHRKAYLSLYVTDLAARRLAMLEKQDPEANWETIKSRFVKLFAPTENESLLVTRLHSRVQLPGESALAYTTEIEELCNRLFPGMHEAAICSHVIKGLNRHMYPLINVLDNSTLDKLRENVSKYEMSSILENHTQKTSNVQAVTVLEQRLEDLTQLVQQLHVSKIRDSNSHEDRNSGLRERYSRRDYEDRSPERYSDGRRSTSRGRRESSRGRYPSQGRQTNRFRSNSRGRDRRDDSRYRDSRRYDSNPRYESDRRPRDHSNTRQVRFEEVPTCWICSKKGHISRNCYRKN